MAVRKQIAGKRQSGAKIAQVVAATSRTSCGAIRIPKRSDKLLKAFDDAHIRESWSTRLVLRLSGSALFPPATNPLGCARRTALTISTLVAVQHPMWTAS